MLHGRSSSVERGLVYGRASARASRLALACFALIAARHARAAEPETATLVYERPAELESCPDEDAFRRAVIARLGRDPFVSDAARTIHVRLSQSGSVLSAVVSVTQASSARGERRIDTHAGCDELASGAALAVSIAIDPLAALGPTPRTEPEQKPEPEPKPAPPAPKPTTPKPTAPKPNEQRAPTLAKAERVATGAFVRAGGRAWLGAVPSLSAGPSLGVGYRRGLVSLALDGLGVLAQTEEVAGSSRSVSVGILGGELSPCLHFAEFRGCAVFGSGALVARGAGVDDRRSGTQWTAWAGLGAGYSLQSGHFSLTPVAELAARFTSTELDLNSAAVWTTPRVFGSLGLELSYDFWR